MLNALIEVLMFMKGVSVTIPFSFTGYRSVKDLYGLLDIIHIAIGRPEYQPANGATHCNQFVAEVCENYGFKGLSGLMANEIIDQLSTHEQWSEIPLEKCQELANTGTLIVAGFKDDPHGHVNVICPGKPKTSGRWGTVPTVANVGKDVFLGKGINWAFSSLPKTWAWRTTL